MAIEVKSRERLVSDEKFSHKNIPTKWLKFPAPKWKLVPRVYFCINQIIFAKKLSFPVGILHIQYKQSLLKFFSFWIFYFLFFLFMIPYSPVHDPIFSCSWSHTLLFITPNYLVPWSHTMIIIPYSYTDWPVLGVNSNVKGHVQMICDDCLPLTAIQFGHLDHFFPSVCPVQLTVHGIESYPIRPKNPRYQILFTYNVQ